MYYGGAYPGNPWHSHQQQNNREGPFAEALVGLTLVVGGLYLLQRIIPSTRQRQCQGCGSNRHDRRTCPHTNRRMGFSKSIAKSNRCECCGSSRSWIERHHTRGGSNRSDFLDMCFDCHLLCGHGGDFRNLANKPQLCRISGSLSYWCA
jgi:hypothetical protein